MTNLTQNYYDSVADDWYFQSHETRFLKTAALMRDFYKDGNILEVGGMSGRIAEFYTNTLEIARERYTVADFAENKLSEARAKGFNTINWDINQSNKLPANQYNFCLCCEVIEHIYDTDKLISGIWEALAPGGILFLTTPNLASWRNRIRLLQGKSPSLGVAPSLHFKQDPLLVFDHIRVCVLPEWRYLLQQHNFQICQCQGIFSRPLHDKDIKSKFTRVLDSFFSQWSTLSMQLLIVAQKPV